MNVDNYEGLKKSKWQKGEGCEWEKREEWMGEKRSKRSAILWNISENDKKNNFRGEI